MLIKETGLMAKSQESLGLEQAKLRKFSAGKIIKSPDTVGRNFSHRRPARKQRCNYSLGDS